MADQKKKQLAYNIVDFLRTSCADGTVKEDDKESLEVAISCIAESFGIDAESESEKAQYSIAPANLVSLLDVYLQTKAKAASSASSTATSAPAASSSSAPKSTGPSADDKKRADALKAEGNALMSGKNYDGAIASYTKAIAIVADPVYFSNRAAAHGAKMDHEAAADDAQRAIDLDPNFTKAYSRLGHALFSSGDIKGSVKAYESGLEREPGNANMQQALNVAKAKLKEQEPVARSGAGADAGAGAGAGAGGMPDLSALAGLMGGGGGGGGGMPDLASLMQNPQMMQMAQQMMSNGGLDRMMQNPNIRRMAEQFQSGGGMPDMAQLAQDPEMRNLAQQFMGGRQ